jgi:site-specific DNA-methyltransferase (adenine-specific)
MTLMGASKQPNLGRRPARIPDILDVIAQLSSDEVPTPPVLARAVLDLLPAEVWTKPDYRWLDPATKSGSLLREVARRLMDGLAVWEPDPQARAEYILRHMLFGCAITQLTGEMTRRSVYVSRDATSEHALVRFDTPEGNLPFVPAEHDYPVGRDGHASGPCRVCGAGIDLERGQSRENYAYAFIHEAYPTEEMKAMRFDVVVGNPPYQMGVEDNSRARPLYHMFIENALALDPRYVAMIVPSRWFTGGLGLDEFRTRMIADRRLRVIVDNPKVYDCFPGVKIRGGVNYFLWDRDYVGDCEFSTRIDGRMISTATRDLRDGSGVLVRDNRAVSILEKVRARAAGSVEEFCTPTLPFGLRDNHPSKTTPDVGDIPVVHGTRIGYLPPEEITKNAAWVDRYKVLLPKASSGDTAQDGEGKIVDVVLGEPIALAPGSACTLTYLIAGMFRTATETENFAHYLATKFVRFLVLQRKSTQDVRPDVFRFVPQLDMTRRWTDEDLYSYFELAQEEIDDIEASIKPRSVNVCVDASVPDSHLPGGRKYRAPGTVAAIDVDTSSEFGEDFE